MSYKDDEAADAFGSGLCAGFTVTAIVAVLVAWLTGHPIIVLALVGIVSAVATTWYSCERYGGFPFTARAAMGRAYATERDRRATEFVKLGIEPEAAIARAIKDMAKEAEEALKQDGK